MKIHASRRRVALCLLLSAGLHLLVFILARLLFPTGVEKALFRVRVPSYLPRQSERFRPRPSVSVSRELLGRLRATGMPRDLDFALGEEGAGELPAIEIPFLEGEEVLAARWEKGEWVAEPDSFPDASLGLLEQTGELPLALDMLDLDAQGRKRTIVILDPETKKLRHVQLHMPAYGNPSPARELPEALAMARRGFAVPHGVPLVEKIHLLHLGGREEAAVFFEGMRKPDPIHRFNTFPARHLLHYVQMKEYPVLFLRYVDVESTEAMVRYLLEGGFGVVDGGQLGWLEVQLRREVGERVERIEIGLEHPLFNAYFEIDRYKMQSTQCGKGSCSSVRPTPGLEVDGRLIAVAGLPRFNGKCDCLSNRLYVNILVYGLIQPSPMGGRYLARSPG